MYMHACNMAPTKQDTKSQGFVKGKRFRSSFAHGGPAHNARGKRKWVPENKVFDGSLKEGQGFAFKRREKIKHEYNKLLRKERRKTQRSRVELEEEYPDHLKHLYLAEQKRLDEEEQEKKEKRWKGRGVDEDLNMPLGSSSEEQKSSRTSDQTEPSEVTAEPDSSQKAPFTQRKQKTVTSYQKTRQEYERMKKEREQKREEVLKDKMEREEALRRYREKKKATYQLLKKKTKKGQPNLNLHMELLLQKIEAQRK